MKLTLMTWMAAATISAMAVGCVAAPDDEGDDREETSSAEQAASKRQCRGAASPISCPCDGSLVQVLGGYKWWNGSQCVVTLQNGDPVASAPRLGGGGKVMQQ